MVKIEKVIEEARNGKKVDVDSRRVTPGCIFVAIKGASEDGTRYIPSALEAGAECIVSDTAATDDTVVDLISSYYARTCLVEDTREAVSALSAAYYHAENYPHCIIGITGTNGKTTCAYLLEKLLSEHGRKVGVLGTVSYRWPGHCVASPLTTPGPLAMHKNLAEMSAAGCDACIMEVSSHALSQKRVRHVPFTVACFTNLTQDHLDFHKELESYFHAKAILFSEEIPYPDKLCAINVDNVYGCRLAAACGERAYTYGLSVLKEGLDPSRHLAGRILNQSTDGLHLEMRFGEQSWELHSPLIGRFNADNLLAVQATGLAMGMKPEDFSVLEGFEGVPGRLERIDNAKKIPVFVDYAHTPDALKNVLQALQGAGFTKIVTVFGCGGDRDKLKRPLMGKAVARYSSIAVVTSDNPRTEDPDAIIKEILVGMEKAEKVIVEPDRRKATEKAIGLLEEGACLLIAGKGHEDYQILGKERIHYSDQEVVRELLG